MGFFLELKKAGESSGFLSTIRPIVGNFLDCFDVLQVVQFAAVSVSALVAAHTDGIDHDKLQKRLDAFLEYSFVYKSEVNEKLGRKVDMPTLVGEDDQIVAAAYGALHGDNNDTAQKNEAVARLLFGNDAAAVSKAVGSPKIAKLLSALAYTLADREMLESRDEDNIGPVVALLGGLDWNEQSLAGLDRTLRKVDMSKWSGMSKWQKKLAELTKPLEKQVHHPIFDAGAAKGHERNRILQGNA